MTADNAPVVLVADDDDDIRRAIVEVLEEEQFQTVEARNGDEVLELVASSKPHVIVLDHRMPGRTGADVVRELRAEGSSIPIVFMTAGKERQLFELGLGCFLRKPFGIEELVAMVHRALEGDC